MSFFVSRAVTPNGQDRADIFARGDVAVLAVGETELALATVRDAVLEPTFDLLLAASWSAMNATVIVVSPMMLLCAQACAGEAWIVQQTEVRKLNAGDRTDLLAGRLVVASSVFFRQVSAEALVARLRTAPWSGLADGLLALATGAVLVAER